MLAVIVTTAFKNQTGIAKTKLYDKSNLSLLMV